MKLKFLLSLVCIVAVFPTYAMKTLNITDKNRLTDQQRMDLAQTFAQKQQWVSVFDIMYPMALEGNVTAQSNLGVLYNLGRGTAQNKEKAYWWFSEAAEKGSIKAINNLAIMYLHGDYVKQNTPQAIKLFERSALSKDTDAMMMLSEIYRLQSQYQKSSEWLKKAAELGNAQAKARLENAISEEQ